jgi:hypothetical protein
MVLIGPQRYRSWLATNQKVAGQSPAERTPIVDHNADHNPTTNCDGS